MLEIAFKKGHAKESGREYEYVSISIDGDEVQRIFIRKTEKPYWESFVGAYEKTD